MVDDTQAACYAQRMKTEPVSVRFTERDIARIDAIASRLSPGSIDPRLPPVPIARSIVLVQLVRLALDELAKPCTVAEAPPEVAPPVDAPPAPPPDVGTTPSPIAAARARRAKN